MKVGVEAAALAAAVFAGIDETLELGPELKERAVRVTEMAAQLYVDQLSGVDTTADLAILQGRVQSLRAAGASAVASAIVEGLRSAAINGLAILASL